jgi:Tfp pilus assembly protein PilF
MVYGAVGQNGKAVEQFKAALDLQPADADLKTKIEAAIKNQTEKNKG